MDSKRFVVNALISVALLAIFAYSSWYVNQPRFGYALYAVTSGDKAYYTLSAIDAIFFYVAGPLSIALIAFIVIQTSRNANRAYLESESSMEPSMPVLVSSSVLESSSLAKGFLKKPVASG